jgi:hypothetical protein
MAFKPRGRQPVRNETPIFFHLKRSWLSMAWAGILGEQNHLKARMHIEQWQEFRRHELATGNSYRLK